MFKKRVLVPTAVLGSLSLVLAFRADAQSIWRPKRILCPLVWTPLSSFVDPRTSTGIEGAAGSLIHNKIYVSHGHRNGDSNFLSVYDIGTNTWTHGLPYTDPVIPRSEMAGGSAYGKHYAIGGRPGLSDVEEYDPLTNAWTTMTSMPTGRGGLGGASWANKIYAIGGRSGPTFGGGFIYNSNEVYDPAVGVGGTWSALAPIPVPVSDNYATVAYLGKVYVFGGAISPSIVVNNVQIYDIATDTWTSGTAMPTPRAAAIAGIIGGKIYVCGGFNGSVDLAVTERYDPIGNNWASAPNLNNASSEMAQGVTFDAEGIYSLGSGIFGVSLSNVERLRVAP